MMSTHAAACTLVSARMNPSASSRTNSDTAPRRIVLSTFGSLGDLHPFLALALELQKRGHSVVVATSDTYRARVEALRLEFAAVRPDLPDITNNREIVRRIMDLKSGGEFLFKQILMPALGDSYDDLNRIAQGCDLLVSHPFSFAAPLVAETRAAETRAAGKSGMKWVSTALTPMSFLSAHDPPVPARVPQMARLRSLGPRVNGWILGRGENMVRAWIEPVYTLREALGLPPGRHPLFGGQHSPQLALALFSPLFGQPQPDWPQQVRVTGFAFHDRHSASTQATQAPVEHDQSTRERPSAPHMSTHAAANSTESQGSTDVVSSDVIHDEVASGSTSDGRALSARMEAFLAEGESPVVFTLGSSAVLDAGRFYETSALAAQRLRVRAVLLVGDAPNLPSMPLPSHIAAFDYAPYSLLFPRACAIVHQGGVGTTAQALRAGKPMLVMPYSHDQPDNAARVVRLGVGRTVPRARYTPARAASELQRLLHDARYAPKAARIGAAMQQEDGVRAACDALEEVLRAAT